MKHRSLPQQTWNKRTEHPTHIVLTILNLERTMYGLSTIEEKYSWGRSEIRGSSNLETNWSLPLIAIDLLFFFFFNTSLISCVCVYVVFCKPHWFHNIKQDLLLNALITLIFSDRRVFNRVSVKYKLLPAFDWFILYLLYNIKTDYVWEGGEGTERHS